MPVPSALGSMRGMVKTASMLVRTTSSSATAALPPAAVVSATQAELHVGGRVAGGDGVCV